MKMYAEHIIGLRAQEHVHPQAENTAVAVRQRFEEIRALGLLLPRTEPKPLGEDGSVFDLDRLAGDGRYVFLSYGARYRLEREPALCYGFLFDAEMLIRRCGALVGPDMLDEYDTILDAVAREVDASLPPLPMASDEEIAKFMALVGEDDPEMATYIQQSSTSRYHYICDAVKSGDYSVEGARIATYKFREAAKQAQTRLRLSGQAALDALQPGMEILVYNQLALGWRLGTIEGGEICLP